MKNMVMYQIKILLVKHQICLKENQLNLHLVKRRGNILEGKKGEEEESRGEKGGKFCDHTYSECIQKKIIIHYPRKYMHNKTNIFY